MLWRAPGLSPEAFKHEQQKEMEHVRYRISAYFDRAVRLHAAEFEILPEIWKRLFDAYHEVVQFSNYGRMIHDLNKTKAEEIETLLSGSPLYEYQKQEVRDATDKTKRYYDIEHYHERQRVKTVYYAFAGYFKKNAIFLSFEAESQLEEMRGHHFLRTKGSGVSARLS